jgi:hypothetical protein
MDENVIVGCMVGLVVIAVLVIGGVLLLPVHPLIGILAFVAAGVVVLGGGPLLRSVGLDRVVKPLARFLRDCKEDGQQEEEARQRAPAVAQVSDSTPKENPMNAINGMKVMGWTLIVAAVLTHFAFCEWEQKKTSSSLVIPFIHAREQFAEWQRGVGWKWNIAGATVWGLVVPTLLAGGGVALIVKSGTRK